MKWLLPPLVMLLGGCSTPTFSLINVILPGGRVNVGQVNETHNGICPLCKQPAAAATTSPEAEPEQEEWKPLTSE